MIKRLFDLLAASVGLAFLGPLLLLVACAVRMETSGPVLFRQIRVARGGRPFEMLKFRTMRADTAGTGPLLTATGDSRITRVGHFLRRTKLDELPQLVNVLKGDMSLVGPRPEVPKYVAMYPPDLREVILSIRPGITDEASIEFRDEGALLAGVADPEARYIHEILPRKLELYARYVRQRSFFGDLRIILRTVFPSSSRHS